jgi:two-component system, cell cycle response regulator
MQILVAEDNPVFQSMLRNMLGKWGYEVVLADNGERAWEILQGAQAPPLALLDWMMPGLDGVEVCRRLREAAQSTAQPPTQSRYVYVILLTAKTDKKDLLEGMDAGADDYVTKPFNTHELRVRLRAGRRILDLQEQLLRAQEALREQATHDGLTELWNRTSILEILQKEAARSARESVPLAVLMTDLDNFKKVNDTYGHLVGDSVLRETANRLRGNVRTYDAVGRYGGEEFLVVLPGCDEAGGVAQAQRLLESIGGQPIQTSAGELAVTCSLGLSWTGEPDPSATKELLNLADSALYTAKRTGRNRVAVQVAECPSADLQSVP